MATDPKLDPRTAPLAEVAEWVAERLPGLCEYYKRRLFRSLDAIAAAHYEAFKGPLKGWDCELSLEKDGAHAWYWDGKEWRVSISAQTLTEAWSRALAAAVMAAQGKEG